MMNSTFADVLYDLRKSRGMNQSELGEIIGVSGNEISKYENARAVPSAMTLCTLANFFGVTTDELLGRSRIIAPDSIYCGEITTRSVVEKLLEVAPDVRMALLSYIDFLIEKKNTQL